MNNKKELRRIGMKRIMAMLLVLSLCFTSGGDIFAAVTDKNSDVMYINEKKT